MMPPAADLLPAPFRSVLRAAGVGRGLLWLRDLALIATDREFRSRRVEARRLYLAFRDSHGPALRPPLYDDEPSRRALVVAKTGGGAMHIELALIKGLQMAGFAPTVLSDRGDLERYYRLAGVSDFIRWDAFSERPHAARAESIIARLSQVEELLDLEYLQARVGRFAVSATLRRLRAGRIDLRDREARGLLTSKLAEGLALAATSHRLLDARRPSVAMFLGNRYAGQAELLDICLARGVDVLAWYHAHRSETLTLKRYHLANRDEHHASIGDATWRMLQQLPWTDARRAAIRRELQDAYASGDWYRRGGTQVNKTIVAADELRRRLQLDPAKPTAVIFPHIVWDATLWWGSDLFADYQEWLVETVRAACRNDRVNWVIKIHPAHVAKARMQRVSDPESSEARVIREHIGALPAHVRVILADTEVNTYSLFPVMDYCVTVRGTIGIEAACLGIRVLTAGTGRYDHRGFTLDSESRAEYLHRLQTIQAIPPMTAAERTLAERYAYGAFVLRPWRLRTWTIDHARDGEATLRVHLNARSAQEIAEAGDMRAFAAWAADRSQEDFLQPFESAHDSLGQSDPFEAA
jgi:hypothetical protein